MTPPPVPAETPGETLRRAAARFRELAAEATPGPWRWQTFQCTGRDNVDCGGVTELVSPRPMYGYAVPPLNVLKVLHESWVPTDPDAAWIVSLSPVVADPLAAWLDWAAVLSEHVVENGGPGDMPGLVPALALAHALLGETS